MNDKDELYSPEKTAQRRDEVIRRMANTPPQPKIVIEKRKRKLARIVRLVRATRAMKVRSKCRPVGY